MKLSSRGDYAVRVLVELASEPADSEPIALVRLAERTAITVKYLEQIMARLRAAGIVRSQRGAHGGYTMLRDPAALTVGEVVRIMDGPLAPSLCASRTAHAACPAYRCPTEANCVMRGLWVEVRDAISDVLDKTTFADLANRSARARSRVSYSI